MYKRVVLQFSTILAALFSHRKQNQGMAQMALDN